jgi:hypothetical protein
MKCPTSGVRPRAEYVVLKAKGISADDFAQAFEWGEGGDSVPNEPLKRRVKRASTGKTVVTIKVKGGEQVVDKMNVWVIWATCTPVRLAKPVFTKFEATAAQQDPPRPAAPAGSEFHGPDNVYTWRFLFTIAPPEIITAQEHPFLEGLQDKRHDVPGAKNTYATEPNNPNLHADEALLKWDASRQQKWTIKDSTGTTTPVTFPTDDAEGNDDAYGHGVDEHDDPYHEYSITPSLAHGIGQITSADGPEFGRYITNGTTDGESYWKKADFREFMRVQLWDGKRQDGRFWFRVSDFVPWHHHFQAKYRVPIFGHNTWENDGSNDGQP